MDLNEIYIKKCIDKILDNINKTNNGLIIASPSTQNPDYYYHWIRDSSITMKVIVNEYIKTKNSKYLEIILKYVNAEYELSKLYPLGGLGEPKFNVNKTCFNNNWERPSYCGPALRGIVMIQIAKLLGTKYDNINNLVTSIIEDDYHYLLSNLETPCFDLWEGIYGYHFYTRLTIAKFLKEYNYYKYNKLEDIYYFRILELIKYHISDKKIISSFDNYGNIKRYSDSSIFIGLNHIDYDSDIFEHKYYDNVITNIEELISYFNNKYKMRQDMIGRYIDDDYYGGNIWIICTISMIHFYKFINKLSLKMEIIIDEILRLDDNFDLDEQYNPQTKKFLSAKNLTWNYCEIYFYLTI
jgi:glucoamylase